MNVHGFILCWHENICQQFKRSQDALKEWDIIMVIPSCRNHSVSIAMKVSLIDKIELKIGQQYPSFFEYISIFFPSVKGCFRSHSSIGTSNSSWRESRNRLSLTVGSSPDEITKNQTMSSRLVSLALNTCVSLDLSSCGEMEDTFH